jgi:hypothetical protein
MFKEFKNVSQKISDDTTRRWFEDPLLDLIVWYRAEKIVGFQLSFEIKNNKYAVTHLLEEGTVVTLVDDGSEAGVFKNLAPILDNEEVELDSRIIEEFTQRGENLETEIFVLVLKVLKEKIELV